ncbi:glycosyltransferase family 4 protein [Paraburkholderia sp. LEh10]|uniref:MraY family glycosyltransferase n=1 Tax=Paraburkholderia sp. LEh10 TaxID=2821353 RepID=UPI001AEB50E4|nr:glycosyltransferase [Paraburkholderia sp. LEh10]MBP0590970.1 glycosyltransferase family 4 protein [Paraburkholderia sp. LEh10]
MINLTLSFLTSFLITLLIVRYTPLLGRFSLDWDLKGVQKNHSHPIPRIGGLAIILAAGITCTFGAKFGTNPREETMLLLAASLAPFASGLLEDMTKRISPRVRLLSAIAGALIGSWLLNAVIIRVDLPLIDKALLFAPFALVFTFVYVAGVANAMNIIDGMNGLSSGISILIFASIAYVAHDTGDWFVTSVAFTMIGAILGFVVWNYPVASIFIGDGGAYFVGFVIAELLVLLVARHPDVCAWYAGSVAIYPIFETVFSIYRRRFLKGRAMSQPDDLHLHTLIYKRVTRHSWITGGSRERGNARTSIYLWALSLIGIVPATFFYKNPAVLFLSMIGFVAAYLLLYRSLVLFRAPRWIFANQRHSIESSTAGETNQH